MSPRRWGPRPKDLERLGAAHSTSCCTPRPANPPAAGWSASWHALHQDRADRRRRDARFPGRVGGLPGIDPTTDETRLRLPWWSASVDSTYLTGKRVFVFGDATHVKPPARVAREEMGFEVVGLGCYNREFARDIRALAKEYRGRGADHRRLSRGRERPSRRLRPRLILGTQMERHIGKRLGIPCAVISAPVHVQDFPARYSPVMGWEGANVLFDTWVHPLVMGLEEHLLQMFREDFEFHDEAGPSITAACARRGAGRCARARSGARRARPKGRGPPRTQAGDARLAARCRARAEEDPVLRARQGARNTEKFAAERGCAEISVDTLYEAKAHYAR
jgi:light-independent protochlorophyllide reductase subunit B